MCCLQLVVLSGNSEIRLYNSRVAKIFSRFCNCRHSRSSISSHNCEGLEHRIESQEVPVEGGTSLETIGLKDLPKVLSSLWRYFCKCRVSAMVLNCSFCFFLCATPLGQNNKPPDVSQAKGHEMCLLTIVCKASVTCHGMLLSSA